MSREEMIKQNEKAFKSGKRDNYGSNSRDHRRRSRSRERRSRERHYSPKETKTQLNTSESEIKPKPIIEEPIVQAEATEDNFMAMFGMEMDFASTKNKDHTKDAREACYKTFLQKREYR